MPLIAIKAILKLVSDELKDFAPPSIKEIISLIDNYGEGGWWKRRRLLKKLNKLEKTLQKRSIHKDVLQALKTQIYIFENGEYELTPLGEIRKLSRSRRIFEIPINKLRFYQTHVKVKMKGGIREKEKYVGQVQQLYRSFKNRTDPELDEALKKIPLTIPIIVSNIYGTDLYLVHNGVHTAYVFHKNGYKKIEAALDTGKPVVKNSEYLTIDEIKPE
ncbi:hypothetical protein KY336_03305 [Candidatus Woesearchaeota archaeon]|nr:hypothetical protein [Candidatus Woesearchaeota archaeon]